MNSDHSNVSKKKSDRRFTVNLCIIYEYVDWVVNTQKKLNISKFINTVKNTHIFINNIKFIWKTCRNFFLKLTFEMRDVMLSPKQNKIKRLNGVQLKLWRCLILKICRFFASTCHQWWITELTEQNRSLWNVWCPNISSGVIRFRTL